MTDMTNRVSRLEIKQDNHEKEIHDINTKVGHIESDMSELKTLTKSNTQANTETNQKLTDILIELSGFKGGFKVIVGIISFIGIGGLGTLIYALKNFGS